MPRQRAEDGARRPRRRVGLWAAFVAVHAWLTLIGVVVNPGGSFYDLVLYRWWAGLVEGGGLGAVLDQGWVYPAGALVPMLVAGIGGTTSTAGYALIWCAMITALDAAALLALVRSGRRPGAWWWLAFLFLLGSVAMGRLDAVIAPLMVIALVLATGSPARARAASALLTLGAWIKVAPGALLLPLLAARRRPLRDVVLPAAAVTAAVVLLVWAGGSLRAILGFLGDQGERGLQIEAVGASGWMVARFLTPDVAVAYNDALSTFEIAGPGTASAARILDVALVLTVAAIGLVVVLARRRGVAEQMLLPAALAISTALFVTDKVGSPQYLTWIAAPIAVSLSSSVLPAAPDLRDDLRQAATAWRAMPSWLASASALGLVMAGLTQAIFPLGYSDLLGAGSTMGAWAMTAVLVLRNALLVTLLAVALLEMRAVLRGSAELREDLSREDLEMLEIGEVEDLQVDPLGPEPGERP